MTDDEINQYLDTIEPIYTDQIKARLLDIRNKWNEIEVEGKLLNMEMHSPPSIEIIDQETGHKEQEQKTAIRDELQLQEQANELKIRQRVQSIMAEMQGYREESKKLKRMPRKQIDDAQKQTELMNILDNRCLQLQEEVKLIKVADVSHGYSLSYGGPEILRGNWEDVIDTISLTTNDGTVLYPEGSQPVDDKDTTQNSDKHELAVFRVMEDLSFTNITISVDPEKLMLRVSAKDKEASISFVRLGLMKINGVSLNRQGHIFLALLNGSFSPNIPGANRAITRLSELLREALNIKAPPFIKNKPQYKLVIPKDVEAKRQAAKRTISYNYDINSTNDLADDLLRKEDKDYDSSNPTYSQNLNH